VLVRNSGLLRPTFSPPLRTPPQPCHLRLELTTLCQNPSACSNPKTPFPNILSFSSSSSAISSPEFCTLHNHILHLCAPASLTTSRPCLFALSRLPSRSTSHYQRAAYICASSESASWWYDASFCFCGGEFQGTCLAVRQGRRLKPRPYPTMSSSSRSITITSNQTLSKGNVHARLLGKRQSMVRLLSVPEPSLEVRVRHIIEK
jgi:hypothetical protein